MSAITQSAGVLDPIRGLFAVLFDALGIAGEPAKDDEPRLSPEILDFGRKIHELSRPAWEALNVQSLRQSLGEVVLSKEFATFLMELISQPSASRDGVEIAPIVTFQPPPIVVARLGKPAADLLAEAISVGVPIAMAKSVAVSAEVRSWTPTDVARNRHQLVLGDLVPAAVSQIMLSSMRGELAMLMLLAAATGVQRLREWVAVILGEIAVQGMHDLVKIASIDLAEEVKGHETHKRNVFAALQVPSAK